MKLCYHCMHQISNEKTNFCPKCGKSLEPETQPPRFLKAGTVLYGKFVIGYPLGAGGFGNTYIGWDRMLRRKVAIKEFYPEQYCGRGEDEQTVTATDEGLGPRFQRGLNQFLAEARNVAALHEVQGVVEIYNFFEANGTGYIVMEYLEGMDVRNILKQSDGRKDYEWCRRVVLTVLYTLKEIHRRGVLHRDIAPDNIFVTKEGIIKLIDFGAAKQVFAGDAQAEIMLKSGYAPIEQYGKEFEQGAYTDIYAVAALFYRMLTGQKPIPAKDRLENDPLVPLSAMGVNIPEQAEMAIMVCLNVIPEYRLQSAEEFMEALGGKLYIPVYEPEWILPPEEKEGVIAKIAALPVGAKVAACLLIIGLAGAAAFGTVTIVHNRSKTATLSSDTVTMLDFSGQTLNDVQDTIDDWNKAYGWELTLEAEDTVFSLTDTSGTVASQSIASGTVLYEPENGNTETEEMAEDAESESEYTEGLDRDERGRLSGTITVTLYSDTVIRYSEISGMNAYEIARKLGVDTGDSESFMGIEDDDESHNYYDLVSLDVDGSTIEAAALNAEENQDEKIEYDKDTILIRYYASDFFCWDELPDFVAEYGNVDALPDQDVYRYIDESTRERSGTKSLGSLVDDSYCVLEGSGYEAGDIVGQTVAPGETYDGSNPGDTALEIMAVGRVIECEGKTVQQLIYDIIDCGFGNYEIVDKSGNAGSADGNIVSVDVYSVDEQGYAYEEITYCKPENDGYGYYDSILFVITVDKTA